MKKKRTLANVKNRQGRIDVALYRIADRLMERLETQHGAAGLREHVLPVIEQAIAQYIPAENLIPRELQALIAFCRLNQLGGGRA